MSPTKSKARARAKAMELKAASTRDEKPILPDAVVAALPKSSFSRLPLEVVLHIASHLPGHLVIPMTHVCSEWRRVLCASQQMWTVLDKVDLVEDSSLDRVRVVAGRAKGALRELNLRTSFIAQADSSAAANLRQALAEVSRLDGARAIKRIKMQWRPCTGRDQAYDALARLATFVEMVAVNVERFEFHSPLCRYPSGTPFWTAMPRLRHLHLVSGISELTPDALSRLPVFFKTTLSPIATSLLETLILKGTSIRDPTFPSFPHLTTIHLIEVDIPNLYGLLTSCATTLGHLILLDVNANSPSNYLPPTPMGTNRDGPPILHLPHLLTIALTKSSPSLWSIPRLGSSSFIVEAPFLKTADFRPRSQHNPQNLNAFTGAYDRYATHQIGEVELTTLLRTSPRLAYLSLDLTDLSANAIARCLRYAPHTLSFLSLRPRDTEDLLDRLGTLLPDLSVLDIRTFDNCGDISPLEPVSIASLADLAFRLAQHRPPSPPTPHLTIYCNPPPPNGARLSIDILQTKLRHLLLRLSDTQVSYLSSSIIPQSRASSGLDAVRLDILQLAAPAAVSTTTTEATAARLPGSDEILRRAGQFLKIWQERREEDSAMEWFRTQDSARLCH